MIATDWRAECAAGHTRAADGTLVLGDVNARELVAAHGTPQLTLDLGVFDAAVADFAAACAPQGIDVAYAGKALIFVALARRLIGTGLHLDACSLGELETAEAAAFPPDRIKVHGCGKSDALLRAIALGRAGTVVVDGLDELGRLARIAGAAPVAVVLRMNAGIEAHTHAFTRTAGDDTKFGLDPSELEPALAQVAAAPGLRLAGLHSHIGSQIYDADPFLANVEVLAGFARAAEAAGHAVERLIVGGGFGVETHPGMPPPLDLPALMQAIATRAAVALGGRPVRLEVEPGRALVARAGTSLYTVMAIKHEGRRRFVVVDGGLADNPRPALYGAYHHPLVAVTRANAPAAQATVCGRSCENDVLVEAPLPADLAPGDVLALATTGAYTYSMASNYNRFTRPPVVLVRNGRHAVGVRAESLHDVLRNDVRDPIVL